jgi:hypothetical protein
VFEYDIDRHIAALKSKGEEEATDQVENIRTEIELCTPFRNDTATLSQLYKMYDVQKVKRDKLEQYSIDYQVEWSILLTIENMKHLVECSIRRQDEK